MLCVYRELLRFTFMSFLLGFKGISRKIKKRKPTRYLYREFNSISFDKCVCTFVYTYMVNHIICTYVVYRSATYGTGGYIRHTNMVHILDKKK